MNERDIVVVGASAGGVAALIALVAGLPADLPAALFVVAHVPPYADSRLPEILSRAGPLTARHAVHGDPIAPGRIYIAPPDRHLLVRDGYVELGRGPRENHSRPAIDPLFRSAARVYGPRVVGVVLSGALYDGSLGLLAVKTRGGVAIVQEPTEAAVDGMPRSAIKLVEVDHVLPVAAIAETLAALAAAPAPQEGAIPVSDRMNQFDAAVAATFATQAANQRGLEPTVYPCPDCGGVLWQADGPLLEFRCHVGHAYAAEVLLGQQAEDLEAALWTSLRLLKEKATLSRQIAARARDGGRGNGLGRIEDQAELDDRYARAIQELLEGMPSPEDQTAEVVRMAADTRDG